MNDQPPKFVSYYRVSTDKQGRSGLGLEAQFAAVQQHTQRSGGEIVGSFQEVESGKHSDRPALQNALEMCKRKKAVLLIAKLDRLSRNLAFIANLIESGVEFVACDNPTASKTMSQMMAVFAEHERDEISKRTKDALQAAKARGVKLGRRDADTQGMADRRSAQAAEFRAAVYPTIRQMRESGQTLTTIADNLNRMKVRTCNNRAWYASTVSQLLKNAA